jgi:hypothetical protein
MGELLSCEASMNRTKIFASFAFAIVFLSSSSFAQSLDPIYGFPFGYSLGYANSYRYRLPTPPYFSIHPPVYYGKRYVRPYGESPYASFPLLGSVDGYVPVPANATSGVPRAVANPHAPCCMENDLGDSDDVPEVNILAERRPHAPRIIINPYAREQIANKD